MSPFEIQALIDEHVHTINNPWLGSLPFMVFKWDKSMGFVSTIFSKQTAITDIANYLNGQSYLTERLYFCPVTYNPPPSNTSPIPKDIESFIQLKCDLEKSAVERGNPILCNGGFKNRSGQYCKVFKCSYCYRKKRDSHTKQSSPEMPLRATSLIHDKKNSQGIEGKKGAKRVKMTSKIEICKFNFSISWDQHGYFINLRNNSGYNIHNGHPKHHDPSNIPIPTRLLNEEEEETIHHVVESACNKTAGRNYMFKRIGKFISSMEVAYLNRKNNQEDLKRGEDIDLMLENFEKSNEIRFTTLSDVPRHELYDDSNFSRKNNSLNEDESIAVSTTKHIDGSIINSPVSNISPIKGIEPLAKVECRERQLSKNDILFIAIAWTVLPAFRLFMLCPEVIWVNVTCHSNNKGFDLLTFSCQTSVAKQCVFMWLWIPNQKCF